MQANRILLAGEARRMEAPCGTALYPGYLISLNSSGAVIPHAVEGGAAEKAFAIEDALQGRIVSTQYAVATGTPGTPGYVGADPVQFIIGTAGTEVNAMLAATYAYTVGEQLISTGDGTLMPATSASSGGLVKQVVAVVLALPGTISTGIDLSGTGAVATLHPVRLL
jgi:translation initiation factor 6 (eIF-6)